MPMTRTTISFTREDIELLKKAAKPLRWKHWSPRALRILISRPM